MDEAARFRIAVDVGEELWADTLLLTYDLWHVPKDLYEKLPTREVQRRRSPEAEWESLGDAASKKVLREMEKTEPPTTIYTRHRGEKLTLAFDVDEEALTDPTGAEMRVAPRMIPEATFTKVATRVVPYRNALLPRSEYVPIVWNEWYAAACHVVVHSSGALNVTCAAGDQQPSNGAPSRDKYAVGSAPPSPRDALLPVLPHSLCAALSYVVYAYYYLAAWGEQLERRRGTPLAACVKDGGIDLLELRSTIGEHAAHAESRQCLDWLLGKEPTPYKGNDREALPPPSESTCTTAGSEGAGAARVFADEYGARGGAAAPTLLDTCAEHVYAARRTAAAAALRYTVPAVPDGAPAPALADSQKHVAAPPAEEGEGRYGAGPSVFGMVAALNACTQPPLAAELPRRCSPAVLDSLVYHSQGTPSPLVAEGYDGTSCFSACPQRHPLLAIAPGQGAEAGAPPLRCTALKQARDTLEVIARAHSGDSTLPAMLVRMVQDTFLPVANTTSRDTVQTVATAVGAGAAAKWDALIATHGLLRRTTTAASAKKTFWRDERWRAAQGVTCRDGVEATDAPPVLVAAEASPEPSLPHQLEGSPAHADPMASVPAQRGSVLEMEAPSAMPMTFTYPEHTLVEFELTGVGLGGGVLVGDRARYRVNSVDDLRSLTSGSGGGSPARGEGNPYTRLHCATEKPKKYCHPCNVTHLDEGWSDEDVDSVIGYVAGHHRAEVAAQQERHEQRKLHDETADSAGPKGCTGQQPRLMLPAMKAEGRLEAATHPSWGLNAVPVGGAGVRHTGDDAPGELLAQKATSRARRGSVPAVAAHDHPHPSGSVHLTVLVHGYKGNQYDLRALRNHIALAIPRGVELYLAKEVEGKSDQPLDVQGDVLATELVEYIKAERMRLRKLSFIGHSMGGLVIRAALQSHLLRPYLPLLHTYVTFSTPHLGVCDAGTAKVKGGLWLLSHVLQSASIKQLQLDAPGLHSLSATDKLGLFNNVIFISSDDDAYVSARSATLDPATGAGVAAKQPRKAEVIDDMHRNLSMHLALCDKVLRFNVRFHPIGRAELSTTMERAVGKSVHVAFIANYDFIHSFTCLFRPYFS
eukprot:TRINITY_DN7527_c0_g1_i1.p1 TRINITY_DN7527_c0_g1~~TRINITY_DN7527_c0_g1_i1.p1  ORF type:complete len:1093 (+),score=292.44 TRINITY_DN7527_c0_g1_i1:526-3804(+)